MKKNLGWEDFFKNKSFAFSRKTFVFPHKTFALSRKDIRGPSQNQLSLDKLFLFTLQLAVVHTARMFTMERFIDLF